MTPAPPAEVSIIEVRHRVVPVSASHVAQVTSSHQVEIMARVNGFLEAITYTEGKTVKEGQVMFRIDQKGSSSFQVDLSRLPTGEAIR